MGRVGLAGLVLVSLALTVRSQDQCSSHGKLVDGKCACDAPLPVDAEPGWVGDTCSVPVHRLFLNAQDVQETCGEGRVCNVVAPNEPVCFSTSIAEMADAAYHLSLLLASNSVDAAVTLRGLLTNFTTAVVDPATNATKLVPDLSIRLWAIGATPLGKTLPAFRVPPQAYPTTAAAFSFSMHTSRDLLLASLQLSRRQLGYGAYTGLGFEDCSATLQQLQPAGSPPAPASLAVSGLQPGAWSFFSVEVPAVDIYELQVAAAATEATKGVLGIFLRHQQLPGEAEAQHDLASDASPAPGASSSSSSSWLRDLSVHATLRRTDAAFRAGTWYIGVYNKGSGPVAYSITAALNGCPNNCSGRGTCDAGTATCTCSQQDSMLAPDCSVSSYSLTLGKPFTAEPRAFSYDRLVLRDVRQQMGSTATTRLALTASFSTSEPDSPGLPDWVTGRPVVLVASSAEAAANASSGGGSPLWPEGAVARMALPARGAQFTLDVGPWMVASDGALHVVLWNPLSGPPRLVGYTLAVAVVGSCLADCSGHGTCDTGTGLCTCQLPFAGGDCSVDLSQYNTTGAACAAGSLRPMRRDDAHATCWQPCKPDGSGYDEAACEQFTCDGPGEGHGQLRRKGSDLACVEDACTAGNYTVVDPSGNFACTRRCSCPEDGSACGVEPECLPGTVQCLRGLVLSAATGSCVEPPCAEGSLRRAYDLDGGAAFAVCVCAAAGDPTSCAFSAPTQAGSNAGCVVACQAGYERQGATAATRLSDGSEITTGGACAPAQHGGRRHGVSGGMVFFYCLLSIALAAGLVVGSKYGMLWYEQYKYGAAFSQVSWPLLGNRGNVGGGVDDW
ncbi:MTA4 protein [Gonium pectorale]|uniref:MTA4 protein n=1 Tax=Gonium pectorale TaxID=33097 RepID=A0A150H004_GONPE|nr:MTA4 protein [Gonium pectorale]|eukprot:KXZ54910.1 MTA4 protein [Gonium pectorale]